MRENYLRTAYDIFLVSTYVIWEDATLLNLSKLKKWREDWANEQFIHLFNHWFNNEIPIDAEP